MTGGGTVVIPASSSSSSAQQPEWQFLQCFGERAPGEEIQDADIISAVEFDATGQHLATGDRGGRVVLFERIAQQQRHVGVDQRAPPPRNGPGFEYRYLTEFQSHEPEFDYLKSLEIEEKINKVRWCRSSNSIRFLLSTNDKTIKLWKVYPKRVTCLTNFNIDHRNGTTHVANGGMPPMLSAFGQTGVAQRNNPLRMPQVASAETILASKCKKVYQNAHAYHINSVSVNSDQETFLSADDLRINLWNLDVTDQSFNIVDIKPSNMEDLTEVITAAEFHPTHCHTFAYSSSKGCIRLADMRSAALCDRNAKAFEEQDAAGSRSFFSEIIASISDIKFSRDGRYILSRDYMTLKLWDLHKEKTPVASLNVHENLRQRLCDLYENDCIFDKFDCCMNGNCDTLATGTYSNSFKLFGVNSQFELALESSRDPLRKRLQPQAKRSHFTIRKAGALNKRGSEAAEVGNDFTTKLLHLAWHPTANVLACAAANSLYMFGV